MGMNVRCPSCGQDNRDQANYCAKCGAALFSPPVQHLHAAEAPARDSREVVGPPTCAFHPLTIATSLCSRCGRKLCRSCARPWFGTVLCPVCSMGTSRPYPWVPQPLMMPPYATPCHPVASCDFRPFSSKENAVRLFNTKTTKQSVVGT